MKKSVDFAVVGSGIAGLRMALELIKLGSVLVLTKGKVIEGSTYHAQGGVAVVFSELDRPKYHFADTINAGDGLCNPEAVWEMVKDGPKRIEELIDWGVRFDTDGAGYNLTKEGAHRVSRVLHSGGDATGANIETVLATKIRNSAIELLEDAYTYSLIEKAGRVLGVRAVSGGELIDVFAKGVFIATGGVGQVYLNTTNPPVSTGDGIYFSFLAGADVMDMEFVQFHPTSLAADIFPRFLISEAVRGEGAVLTDHKGNAFMEKYHPLKDLAPRNIVSIAIFNEMRKQDISNVLLDISPIGIERFEERFPTITSRLKNLGIDLSTMKIPVVPAAHYFMGGIRIAANGKTSLKGLYASGETTSSGLHGANRLASNSLLESLVFAKRAADNARHLRKTPVKEIPLPDAKGREIGNAKEIISLIRSEMEKNAGIERTGDGLRKNTELFRDLWVEYGGVTDLKLENVILKSFIVNGFLISHTALERTESRGAHFRADYPFTNNRTWKHHIVLNKNLFKWIR